VLNASTYSRDEYPGRVTELADADSWIVYEFTVGNGFVTSVPHPGGNITGFASYEQTISVKWLELLKEIAPRVTRAAFLHDPLNPNLVRILAGDGA
jgi:hypothetical protein